MSTLDQDIAQIIADTESRKLVWSRSTPTSFVCQKPLGPGQIAQLSLQKVVQTRIGVLPGSPRSQRITTDNFIFQLTEKPRGLTRLVIHTQQPQYAELRPQFTVLFDKVSENADREGLDFLRKVIEQ